MERKRLVKKGKLGRHSCITKEIFRVLKIKKLTKQVERNTVRGTKYHDFFVMLKGIIQWKKNQVNKKWRKQKIITK